MIPQANITAWRAEAPWSEDAQVEQDLVLSRAVVVHERGFIREDRASRRSGAQQNFHPSGQPLLGGH